jgi:hypothetical protein
MITTPGLATLRSELNAIRPTIVVNPEDAPDLIREINMTDWKPKVEVSELAEPGQITIFQGLRMPVTDLGGV